MLKVTQNHAGILQEHSRIEEKSVHRKRDFTGRHSYGKGWGRLWQTVFQGFFSINACDLQSFVYTTKGVFLVKMKNAFEPVKRNYSVNTYSRISTVPRGVSEVSERAREWSMERMSEVSGALQGE